MTGAIRVAPFLGFAPVYLRGLFSFDCSRRVIIATVLKDRVKVRGWNFACLVQNLDRAWFRFVLKLFWADLVLKNDRWCQISAIMKFEFKQPLQLFLVESHLHISFFRLNTRRQTHVLFYNYLSLSLELSESLTVNVVLLILRQPLLNLLSFQGIGSLQGCVNS